MNQEPISRTDSPLPPTQVGSWRGGGAVSFLPSSSLPLPPQSPPFSEPLRPSVSEAAGGLGGAGSHVVICMLNAWHEGIGRPQTRPLHPFKLTRQTRENTCWVTPEPGPLPCSRDRRAISGWSGGRKCEPRTQLQGSPGSVPITQTCPS